MEIHPSTFNIFQLINVSNKVFKLHQLSKPISQEQCQNILYELQHVTITSEQIISQILNKSQDILNIKYQLYKLLSSQSLISFQNDFIPADKNKKPSQINLSNLDTSLNSLIKKIQLINSEARYIGLQLGMLIDKNNIPLNVVDKLNSFPLRALFKMLAKAQGSTLKRTKFIMSVKNMLILQQMIMLLFGQIYNQMKRICKQIRGSDQVNENCSTASSIKEKKSSLSISIQEYLENIDSNNTIKSRQSIKGQQKLPGDFNFTRNRLSTEMDFNKKGKKKQVKVKGVCCFNI